MQKLKIIMQVRKRRKGHHKYPSQYLEELSGLSELVAFSNISSVPINLPANK